MQKIDFDAMEEYLKTISDKKKFIYCDYEFSEEEFDRLCDISKKYKLSRVRRCFYNSDKPSHLQKYKLILTCKVCGKKETVYVSGTKMIDIIKEKIKRKFEYTCCFCLFNQEREMQKKKQLKEQINKKENHDIAFNVFEELIINPNAHWNRGVSVFKKIDEIKSYLRFVDSSEVKEMIKKLEYKEFLRTPYWKAISEYKKYENKKCQLCSSTDNLHVHHTNYRILGEEIFKMDELTVLCDKCHNKFHKGGDE